MWSAESDQSSTVQVPVWVALVTVAVPAVITGIFAWLATRSTEKRAERHSRHDRERIAVAAITRTLANARDALFDDAMDSILENRAAAMRDVTEEHLVDLPRKTRGTAASFANGFMAGAMSWRMLLKLNTSNDVRFTFIEHSYALIKAYYDLLTEIRVKKRHGVSDENFAIAIGPSKYIDSQITEVQQRVDALQAEIVTIVKSEDPKKVEKIHAIKEQLDAILSRNGSGNPDATESSSPESVEANEDTGPAAPTSDDEPSIDDPKV